MRKNLVEQLKQIVGEFDIQEDKNLKMFVEMCQQIREDLTNRIIQIESSEKEKDKVCEDLIKIVEDRQNHDNKKNA